MTVEFGITMLGIAFSLVSGIIVIAISWGSAKKQAELFDESLKQVWTIISKVREWQTQHEREAADRRLELEREISKLRESDTRLDSKMDELMRLVKSVNEKMDRLEQRNEKRDLQ